MSYPNHLQEPDTADRSTVPTEAIIDEIEDSEETISINNTAEGSASDYEQTIDTPTEDTEDIQATPDLISMEATPEPCIDWSTEDTDIGEPPVYMLAGIEIDDDDDWQISGQYIPSTRRPHAKPLSQSTVATVVATTATALGLTLVRCTKLPWSRPGPHSA